VHFSICNCPTAIPTTRYIIHSITKLHTSKGQTLLGIIVLHVTWSLNSCHKCISAYKPQWHFESWVMNRRSLLVWCFSLQSIFMWRKCLPSWSCRPQSWREAWGGKSSHHKTQPCWIFSWLLSYQNMQTWIIASFPSHGVFISGHRLL
jgi:hypothetical protein